MTNYDAKDKQKHKLKQEGIEINLKINKKDQGYIENLLIEGKSQKGPCTFHAVLLNAIHTQSDRKELIVKTEMPYYSDMHKLELFYFLFCIEWSLTLKIYLY